MRRATFGSLLVVAGCGLDIVGTAGPDAGVPPLAPAPAPSSSSGALPEAGVDGSTTGTTVDVDGSAENPVVPSHVPAAIDPNAPDLSGIVAIDTTDRKLTASAPLPNVRFEAIDGKAVLFVGRWDVGQDIAITGKAPLIVLAAGAVTIGGRLDAAGHAATPGPGGAAGDQGPGRGLFGTPDGTDDPGGGGAGHATAGAGGGNGAGVSGGAGGPAYGGKLEDFVAGSGGGHGTPFLVSPCTNNEGAGGVGGGALQITSRISITVTSAGVITTGGGGGRGGCLNGGASTMSGGGGGSGGTLFLEAPAITVDGVLAANGGGGGGGAQSGTSTAGKAGQDALASLTAAAGGPGSVDRAGGAGGTGNAAPVKPQGNFNNAGGGGGARGHIWLRTRGTNPAVKTSSPTPSIDTTL